MLILAAIAVEPPSQVHKAIAQVPDHSSISSRLESFIDGLVLIKNQTGCGEILVTHFRMPRTRLSAGNGAHVGILPPGKFQALDMPGGPFRLQPKMAGGREHVCGRTWSWMVRPNTLYRCMNAS